MMRTSVVLGSMLLALAVAVGTGISQDGKKEGGGKIKGQLPPHWKELGLSKDQIAKIYGIQIDYKTKIKKLEEQVKEMRQIELSEMRKVLTDDQKSQLAKILLGEDPKKKDDKDKKDK